MQFDVTTGASSVSVLQNMELILQFMVWYSTDSGRTKEVRLPSSTTLQTAIFPMYREIFVLRSEKITGTVRINIDDLSITQWYRRYWSWCWR
jgi:hypothetical protein